MTRLFVVALSIGTLLVVCSLAFGAPKPADRLVLQPDEVAGLRVASPPVRAARREIRELLPKRARPGRVEAARYRSPRPGIRLDVRAATVRRPALARRALRAWRREQRTRTVRARGVGATAYLGLRRRGGRVQVAAALRRGNALALVDYRTPGTPREARRVGRQLLELEAARIRTARSRTAWDRALEGIRPDGTIPTRTLLQLTSLMYGPIAGVKLPPGSRGVPPTSGTWVLSRLRSAGPSLSPGVRRAIERALRRDVREAAARVRAGGAQSSASTGQGCKPTVGGLPFDATLSSQAEMLRDLMATRIPGYGTPAWAVCVYRSPLADGKNYATTTPWKTSVESDPQGIGFFDQFSVGLGTLDMCHVRLRPPFFTQTPVNERWTLAHEMFHCLRQERAGDQLFSLPPEPPLWADEGLADWAAQQVAPGAPTPPGDLPGVHYTKYLERVGNSGFSLPGLSYEAFGFFGRVEQSAGPAGASTLWSRVPAVWDAGNNSPLAFEIVTGSEQPDVLNEWGSGLFRQSSFPPDWFQTLPFALSSPSPQVKLFVPFSAGEVRREVSNYRAGLFFVSSPLPLVRVTVEGNGRVTDGTTDFLKPQGEWFCFGGSCQCPAGQTETTPIPPHTDLPSGALHAGIAAGAGTSALVLDPHSLSEFCDQDEDPPTSAPTGGGGSNGDPHLVTFDGTHYDFQAAGEYVLAKGPGIAVHARQEPWARSRYVSINTQLALRVGRARVTVEAGTTPVVRVGGRRRGVGGLVRLPGGGTIARASAGERCDGLVVSWPNGSTACIWSVGMWGLAIRLEPGEAVRGRLRGLLGDGDGDPANDFRTRAGRRLDPKVVTGFGGRSYATLYRLLGDSWRVRPSESLLRYRSGEASGAFYQRDFPARIFTVRNLSPAARARAERICRAQGVSDPDVLEGCIVDVALTRQTEFAEAAAVEQQLDVPPPTLLGQGDNPWVLVDRRGTTHVVWRRGQPDGDQVVYRRRPAGTADFEPEVVLPGPAGAGARDFTGPVIFQDPAPSERLVVLASRCCGGPETFALTSTDGGAAWSGPAPVFEGPLSGGPSDGRGNLVATTPSTAYAVSDGTRLAPLPLSLVPQQPGSVAVPGADEPFNSSVAVDPGGTPVLAWDDLGSGFARLGIGGPTLAIGAARSTDVAGGPRGVAVLTTSAEPTGRRLEARRVVDGALTPSVRVSAPGDGDPIFPYLSADAEGAFHAVWVTAGRDLAYSRSDDGGATWTAPAPLASAPEGGEGIFDPVVSGGPGRDGWAAWDENSASGEVFAVPVG